MCEVCGFLKENSFSKKSVNKIKERKVERFTSKEYEQHEASWNSYGECWEFFKKWNDKQKIEKINKELKLIQLSQGNCVLCAINSDWINEGIFFRGWNSEEVKKELEGLGLPIIVFEKEVLTHKQKHLSVKSKTVIYDSKKHIKTIQKDIKTRNRLNTLELKDHIDSQILTLTMDIRELETNNLTASSEYKSKIEMLKSFIDLKIKTEGGEVQDVNIVNFWDKLKEKGGDL